MRRVQVPGPLALAALGVVFGDIGTSPLYTLNTCFTSTNTPVTLANVLGIISLLAWALIVVVCVKYVRCSCASTTKAKAAFSRCSRSRSRRRLLGKIYRQRVGSFRSSSSAPRCSSATA